jgi:galactokinase
MKQIIKEHKNFLQDSPSIYFSPGRVNLIGEHIDYLGGHVFPTAIDLGTYGLVTKRQDKEVHFLSHNYKQYGEVVVSLDDLSYQEKDNWANYCKGMFDAVKKEGHSLDFGLNILIYGTLPSGAGLSSSASLEVLIGHIIKDQYKIELDPLHIVKMAQKVENNYIGVNCGIMDQFAVGMGKEEQAMYLNTETLDFQYVPLRLKDYKLIIANTNKKRSLSESAYNKRRIECDKGLAHIQSLGVKVEQLCDLSLNDLVPLKETFSDEIVYKRVLHAVSENERTNKAVTALQNNDFILFGQLMNQSHKSLQEDFEVSCKELDTLVSLLQEQGAIGSRMTGAGFGGCTVSLIHKDKVDDIIKEVDKEYIKQIGYKADFYQVVSSDGTKKVEVKE